MLETINFVKQVGCVLLVLPSKVLDVLASILEHLDWLCVSVGWYLDVLEVDSCPFEVVILSSKSDLCVGCGEAFILQLCHEHFKVWWDLISSQSWLLWA